MSSFVNIRSDILPYFNQLSSIELRVYFQIGLVSCSGKYFKEISYTNIATELNSSPRVIIRAMSKLVDLGLIECKKQEKPGRQKNSYRMAHVLVTQESLVDLMTSDPQVIPLVTQESLPSDPQVTSVENSKARQDGENKEESTSFQKNPVYKGSINHSSNISSSLFDARIPQRIAGLMGACSSESERSGMRRDWLLLVEEYGIEATQEALNEHTTDPRSPRAIVGWVRRAIVSNPQKYANSALATKRRTLLRELSDLEHRVQKWGVVTLDHWSRLKEGEKEAIELWGSWEKLVYMLEECAKERKEFSLGRWYPIPAQSHYTTFKFILEKEIKPLLDKNIG